jgi:hypothetical protein
MGQEYITDAAAVNEWPSLGVAGVVGAAVEPGWLMLAHNDIDVSDFRCMGAGKCARGRMSSVRETPSWYIINYIYILYTSYTVIYIYLYAQILVFLSTLGPYHI